MALESFGRREFLKLASGVCLAPGAPPVWREARELVRRGSLGHVVFCRVSRSTVDRLGFVLDGAVPVREFHEGDQLVLCGTEATLVLDRHGYRRFA